ncbi:hypothetical protein BH11CYA1_BH11CYA1_26510 [soil metagenome]
MTDTSSLVARIVMSFSSSSFLLQVLTLSLIVAGPVQAQQQQVQQQQQAQGQSQGIQRPRRPAPVESVHRNLQQWPSTVPVPLPPDAKFVAGYQSQYLNTKSMTFFRFTTINPAASVLDWYKRSLQSAGWALKEHATTGGRSVSSISAIKNGVTCSINVLAPLTSKDRTSVQISYTDR